MNRTDVQGLAESMRPHLDALEALLRVEGGEYLTLCLHDHGERTVALSVARTAGEGFETRRAPGSEWGHCEAGGLVIAARPAVTP